MPRLLIERALRGKESLFINPAKLTLSFPFWQVGPVVTASRCCTEDQITVETSEMLVSMTLSLPGGLDFVLWVGGGQRVSRA